MISETQTSNTLTFSFLQNLGYDSVVTHEPL